MGTGGTKETQGLSKRGCRQSLGCRCLSSHPHLEGGSLGILCEGIWRVIPGPQCSEGTPRPKVTQRIRGEKQPRDENSES